MRKILRTSLWHQEKRIASCDYLSLDPYAPSTARTFSFHNVRFTEKAAPSYRDELTVRVAVLTKSNQVRPVYEFAITLADYADDLQWVYGLVHNDYGEAYEQEVVDVFRKWGKGEKVDWFGLPATNHFKSNYLAACFYYSSISTELLDKEEYRINMDAAKEYRDVLYLLSEAFLGERGYMGHSFHTFVDCLQVLFPFPQSRVAKGKKVVFENVKEVSILDDALFFDDVKKELSAYGFSIEAE